MNTFDPKQYSASVAALLGQKRVMPLGRGEPDMAAKPKLAAFSPESIAAPSTVRDRGMAAGGLAGLWLYFDHLDESHRITQELETPTGSYWHAILHRREGDFGNAKYWFRRVGKHPVLAELAEVVTDMEGARELPTMGLAWDPLGFVDLCESAQTGRAAMEKVCRQIQQREWELLFDFCYRRATT